MADEAPAGDPGPPVAESTGIDPNRSAASTTGARLATTDPLNTEFLYYSSVLRTLAPTLSQEGDRRNICPWIRKLYRPEYQSSKFREKRNRYLSYLTNSLLLDESVDIFREFPPDGALADLETFHPKPVPAAQWEIDNMWQDTLQHLPEEFQLLECFIHDSAELCKHDHGYDKILDQEFQFFLYLAKPYASMITGGAERTRIAAWLQILCSICGNECCSHMKAIRNDYMMAMLGYLIDLRAVGPFAQYPSWQMLKPLAEVALAAADNCQVTDPTGCYANDFLAEQPVPDDGAFCYIALSGDLVSRNIAPN
ncbi:uncharacterized protein LOC115876568 [Sitophilus oryzae]|uniref:Uncharacterized protein LOC115876568 n=1 Tax=Sitophilus oryzae TaxID=7048 RepID=A0A6J2XAF2_SITOR|nr:uncharacterized protein LOC115876568 [Sitophilus oryzae]